MSDITVTIEREDGGCEPWVFDEFKFLSGREAEDWVAKEVASFNEWAIKAGTPTLKYTIQIAAERA